MSVPWRLLQIESPLLGWIDTAKWQFGTWTTSLLAQGAPVSAPVLQSRNLAVDYLVVLVLFGLALFAICRSSRRL